MDKGLVDLYELRKNIGNAKLSGKSSFCFKIGNKIWKIYAREEDGPSFIPLDRSKIYDFSSFSADTIVFPDEYIYENNDFAGEILKYINSKRLDKAMNNEIIINSLLENYDLVINDLYTFDNISMIDLCYVNILYSNKKGFHLIDTTEWCIEDKALKKNIYRFNESLIDVLLAYLSIPIVYCKNCGEIDKTFLKNMEKYGGAGKQLQNNMQLIANRQYRFMDLMFAYMEACRIHYGKDIETLKEIKEFTKILKKG